jgi:hypothetical protein
MQRQDQAGTHLRSPGRAGRPLREAPAPVEDRASLAGENRCGSTRGRGSVREIGRETGAPKRPGAGGLAAHMRQKCAQDRSKLIGSAQPNFGLFGG